MTTFAIEKGIPLEPPSLGRPIKYPFRELEVGDSFLVPNGDRGGVASAASWAGKRHKKRFSTREVEGGIRVWRIE